MNPRSRSHALAALVVCAVAAGTQARGAPPGSVSAADYGSIQTAIDANPGKMIRIPSGEHEIAAPIVIRADGTGLYGYGTIIQANPDAPIIDIRSAADVRIEELTLTRPEGRMETQRDGIRATGCDRLRLSNVRIVNNRSDSAAIRIEQSRHGRAEGCEIINYKRIGLDDRTRSDLYGYAFRAIIGDGLIVKTSADMMILNNSIVEQNIRSDEDAKNKFKLGRLTEGREPTRKGKLAPVGDYVPHWHQGSAIVITSPEITRDILVAGNLIENAAQGVDIHADHVTFSNNVIHHAFVGIKCMHGSRNVTIANNNVSHTDLWGLVMQPGTASHPGKPNRDGDGSRRASEPNVTRGNIIANNIFSDFGEGHEFYNWKGSDSRNVLQFESGPLPGNPPLSDIVVQGNVVYDSGRDRQRGNDQATPTPRYNYAVYLDPKLDPESFRFSGNIFHPGARGVSNAEIEP